MSIFDIKRIKPTVADLKSDLASHGRLVSSLAKLPFRHGPLFMLDKYRRYPWLRTLLAANTLLEMSVRTRTGAYREASGFGVSHVAAGIGELVDNLFAKPETTVIHEDLVPPEILYGMGLNPWMAELLGIIAPLIRSEFAEPYIDAAESEGTPPDICSLPKCTMGIALKGEMPKPKAILTSNMPCDGGMSSYSVLERELKVPTFRLDIPYNFYGERAVRFFAGELKRAIAWLEEHTPGRMDWDRMRQVCEIRNKAQEYQMEVWDLVAKKPAPMAGEALYLGHMMYSVAMPGRERGVEYWREMLVRTKKIAAAGGALPDERFRCALWNPPTLIYPELFVWAEQKYGVALLMDMISYNRHPYIDTKSPDTMLQGLARVVMEGPMARHTRGPSENFFSDLFALCERFSMDMIWMAGHIGCKNTMALNGMFREKCRERGIPLLIINYDLSDTRVVSPAEIRKQAEAFMETVMKARPL
jgi:hypothetical protein